MTSLNLHINGIGLKESLTDIRGITHLIICKGTEVADAGFSLCGG